MSLVACVRAMYSDSVLDRVMMGCFLVLQETTPVPMKNVNPEIECWWR